MGTQRKKVVYTSGSWDLFHVGHLNILERSKALGDVLVVGVSTDKLIEDYKNLPPVIPYAERFRIIESIRCVDQAVKQSTLMDIELLKRHRVDIVTIGDDWKGKHLDGIEWMNAQPGKQVVYLEYTPGVSTTGIKRKIIQSTYEIISAEFRREVRHMEEWKRKQGRDE